MTWLRRTLQIFLVSAMALLGTLVFQNCGTYQGSVSETVEDDFASGCVGSECPVDLEAVTLEIANQSPILLDKPAGDQPAYCTSGTCFDVAGYCDVAGFPDSFISILLRGPTGFGERGTTGKCVDGRFRVLVEDLPGGFDYDSIHTLVVTLRVIDENGYMHENPIGLNRKEISIVAQAPAATPTPPQQP